MGDQKIHGPQSESASSAALLHVPMLAAAIWSVEAAQIANHSPNNQNKRARGGRSGSSGSNGICAIGVLTNWKRNPRSPIGSLCYENSNCSRKNDHSYFYRHNGGLGDCVYRLLVARSWSRTDGSANEPESTTAGRKKSVF